jgi:hypothetical protein
MQRQASRFRRDARCIQTPTLMRYSITLLLLAVAGWANAQSSVTETLYKKHSDALTLFFYNNTLRMLNQTNDKDFDALIKDIEKMRFLMIKKASGFETKDYQKLVADYKSDKFEEMMSSRHQGKNFEVFVKEKNGETKGMLVLVNDTENLFILDILGRVAMDKISSLYRTVNENTEIGQKIKGMANKEGQ